MRQSSYEILGDQKKLRLIAGDHFISLPMKVKKADVKEVLNSDEVLEAGTLITKDGKKVTTTSSTTDVYGVVYQDVSFKGSMSHDSTTDNATEVVPVIVHGVLYETQVKLDKTNASVEKAALKQIIFGA
ncbi:MAG: hypothetical protein E6X72_00060 [Clostridioides difficile]|uniref:hypothetical protein n=1 Tax=Clostridium butyricum TaxID=1492 RepID=UPI0002C99895|nr:hypothetical protein [Clostridium butyricum]EMU52266.1 hypothetical protein CBDKU1_36980 [Clostridium butyricum DKU-01]MDU4852773.1 hypothetical protein [Clostridioides difficile]